MEESTFQNLGFLCNSWEILAILKWHKKQKCPLFNLNLNPDVGSADALWHMPCMALAQNHH